MDKKLISIATGCLNEEQNLPELYSRLIAVWEQLPQYDWEMVIADNCSCDRSREILREIAQKDKRVKVIFNSNNFGVIRSGFNVLTRTSGDAVIMMCSDLQDPPEMIPEFLKHWEEGYRVVCAVRKGSEEPFIMRTIRKFYYYLLRQSSEGSMISGFYGFGLYDRRFVDALKLFHDPYPYFRGLVSEIGMKRIEIPFVQKKRKGGKSSYNFFSYYDTAMTGFVNHTKLPLRLSVFCGFALAFLSLLTAIGYLVYKLLYWDTFQLGLAPLVIGLFFFSAVQLIFIGVIGEYIGAIWTQVKNKPLAIEEEKINFDE
ncbi:MAG: glycosyltransferase family 2 protein [Victivallales bacterium]|jgi:glycosyltransferase involved in cell wall biosynthesis|nr:glycosyltransferase family 2 protein [Victivallales bacterium]